MSIQIIKPKISSSKSISFGVIKASLSENKSIFFSILFFGCMGYVFFKFSFGANPFFANVQFYFYFGCLYLFFRYLYNDCLDRVAPDIMNELAVANGWKCEESLDFIKDDLLMFRRNDLEISQINSFPTRVVKGFTDGVIFSFFYYYLTIGNDSKSQQIFPYTVFVFTFAGKFPHLYLNSSSNPIDVYNSGQKIKLVDIFEEKFTLYSPEDYEIEALQIFTPDILSYLLESGFSYDVEFYNQKMYVFVDGADNDFNILEKKLNETVSFSKILENRLNTMSFEKVGDKNTNL